eukprot:CAMPEP_0178513740 /NCGR_PEP_ID=MMETSP0696-20121128/23641_1 /TAXON_ID=265572 /ORGANISM="Extubocellulus spinifer, Strain CCMP396" /LENGTH=676 /DNA_ID=CAMNT_0020143769 /DNA_START=122 /DNA_END=2152 /DNA_ORIENTATION=-
MTVTRRRAGGGIFSITAATAAAAATAAITITTISHQASAFAPISGSTVVHRAGTSLRTAREVSADIVDLSSAAEMGQGGDQWVEDGFNDANGSLNGQKQSLSRLSIDDGQIQGPGQVLVYDTSLRDGTQGESVSVSCDDKLKIATRLSTTLNADFIEAGWPGSNPKDAEFFSRAQTELDPVAKSRLVAFGSTRRKGIRAEDDPQIKALVDSGAPTVCIVAKSHLWQVTDIIRATPEENLEMITDSVSYLTSLGVRTFVDLEHFFDGYRHDAEYAMQCCQAAADAGAKCLVLCDTNGGSMPWQVDEMTREVVERFPDVTVGMHAHNDCGMAVANSVTAARAGAGLVQGTINGIGERTGNADLCSIVPSLGLHVGSRMTCKDNLPNITSVSRFVDETLNRQPVSSAPFVGASAFAHKGGLHVAAMERSPLSYQHIDPAKVGNEKRILISELSGRQNIMGKIREVGVDVDADDVSARATAILNRVKELESFGYTFEGAEASVDLMILHGNENYCPPFKVLDYSAMVFDTNLDSASRVLDANSDVTPHENSKTTTARATIKVRTINMDDASTEKPYIDRLEVSDGNGPVDALASALKQALMPNHPHIEDLELVDYKVRILDPESATSAATRVMIEFRDNSSGEVWTTVSVDRNVISASLNALVDGLEYALVDHGCLLHDF